jgi:hypothetical protein
MEQLKFKGRLAHFGRGRMAIEIPLAFKKEVKKLEGKDLKIVLEEIKIANW